MQVTENISPNDKVCDVDVPAELCKTTTNKLKKKKINTVNTTTDLPAFNVEKSPQNTTKVVLPYKNNQEKEDFLAKCENAELSKVSNDDDLIEIKEEIPEKRTDDVCEEQIQPQEVEEVPHEPDDKMSVGGDVDSDLSQGGYVSDVNNGDMLVLNFE